MLETILKKIEKVLKGKLNKCGLQEKLTKHSNYLVKAKEIWAMINEDLEISGTVENKFISKIEKFEKAVIAKFPELTKDDVIELKKSIVGEINAGKDMVLSQVDRFEQLQIFNTKLQEENEKLKDKLSKLEPVVTSNTVTVSNENDKTTITEEVKQDNE